MSKEVSEAHEERVGVSDSTRRERERWIETLRDAIKSGIPKHVRYQAEQAIAGIEKSIRFGGTRLLRNRMAELEIERDALLAERDAAQKDADRYRWLRDIAGKRIMNELANDSTLDGWDAKIDAALQGEQP